MLKCTKVDSSIGSRVKLEMGLAFALNRRQYNGQWDDKKLAKKEQYKNW